MSDVLPFTSVQSHYRGFTFKQDYESNDEFIADMARSERGEREISWAILIDTTTGRQINQFHRGDIL